MGRQQEEREREMLKKLSKLGAAERKAVNRQESEARVDELADMEE